jgi:hypothetical protein
MLSTASLVDALARDFPQFTFRPGPDFKWSADDQTIYYNSQQPGAPQQLLHELGHALLGHNQYDRDITLVALERDAWDHASTTLSPRYTLPIADDYIQTALDSYRDWLHARSTCPRCTATGLQIKHRLYRCLACSYQWRVNEARICALRRYTTT